MPAGEDCVGEERFAGEVEGGVRSLVADYTCHVWDIAGRGGASGFLLVCSVFVIK